MGKLDALREALAALKLKVTTEADQVKQAVKGLSDQVQALTEQLANGEVVTEQDLADLNTTVGELSASVEAIYPPETPVPQGGGGPGEPDDPGP